MEKRKLFSLVLLFVMMFNLLAFVPSAQAAGLENVLGTLSSSTMAPSGGAGSGGGLLEQLFGLLFDKILGPIFNIFNSGGKSTTPATGNNPVKVTPLPPVNNPGPIQNAGVLRGKTIAVDPGHGGSNPGAVANGTRESDNNLAVASKLRDKLVQAGAKVVMTRNSDSTVAPEGNSLGEELQARLTIAKANNADVFVSIHSNSNPNQSIAGAMTFYPSGSSNSLALEVQSGIVRQTNAIDKATAPATFYVLRNATMPSILVEMGFVTNPSEAVRLQEDGYRNKMAQGIFEGIVRYITK